MYFTYRLEYFDESIEDVRAFWPAGARKLAKSNLKQIHGPKVNSACSKFMRFIVDYGNGMSSERKNIDF